MRILIVEDNAPLAEALRIRFRRREQRRDVYVSQLRKKLRRAGAPEEMIETVWGLGYRIKA